MKNCKSLLYDKLEAFVPATGFDHVSSRLESDKNYWGWKSWSLEVYFVSRLRILFSVVSDNRTKIKLKRRMKNSFLVTTAIILLPSIAQLAVACRQITEPKISIKNAAKNYCFGNFPFVYLHIKKVFFSAWIIAKLSRARSMKFIIIYMQTVVVLIALKIKPGNGVRRFFHASLNDLTTSTMPRVECCENFIQYKKHRLMKTFWCKQELQKALKSHLKNVGAEKKKEK